MSKNTLATVSDQVSGSSAWQRRITVEFLVLAVVCSLGGLGIARALCYLRGSLILQNDIHSLAHQVSVSVLWALVALEKPRSYVCSTPINRRRVARFRCLGKRWSN